MSNSLLQLRNPAAEEEEEEGEENCCSPVGRHNDKEEVDKGESRQNSSCMQQQQQQRRRQRRRRHQQENLELEEDNLRLGAEGGDDFCIVRQRKSAILLQKENFPLLLHPCPRARLWNRLMLSSSHFSSIYRAAAEDSAVAHLMTTAAISVGGHCKTEAYDLGGQRGNMMAQRESQGLVRR